MTPPNHDYSQARPQPVPTELQRGAAAENTDLDYEDNLEREFANDLETRSPQRRTMNLPGATKPEPPAILQEQRPVDRVVSTHPILWLDPAGAAIHTVLALTSSGRMFTLDVTVAPDVVWNEIPGPEL